MLFLILLRKNPLWIRRIYINQHNNRSEGVPRSFVCLCAWERACFGLCPPVCLSSSTSTSCSPSRWDTSPRHEWQSKRNNETERCCTCTFWARARVCVSVCVLWMSLCVSVWACQQKKCLHHETGVSVPKWLRRHCLPRRDTAQV